MDWLRIDSHPHLETRLRPALEQVQFNTCSGPGHRDKFNRLICMIGQRPQGATQTDQQLGVIFGNSPELQAEALEMIQAVYAERHDGASLHIWMPRPKSPAEVAIQKALSSVERSHTPKAPRRVGG